MQNKGQVCLIVRNSMPKCEPKGVSHLKSIKMATEGKLPLWRTSKKGRRIFLGSCAWPKNIEGLLSVCLFGCLSRLVAFHFWAGLVPTNNKKNEDCIHVIPHASGAEWLSV